VLLVDAPTVSMLSQFQAKAWLGPLSVVTTRDVA